ncbi:MAG: CvpA family protein [Alphaproteobacteria bacterium]|nr:CvpA family protein [Alphaproteobacteria bacterium]
MAQDLCTIDILIASILALSVLIGFCRGAIKEIFTVLSWTGSILLTIILFPLSRNIISNFIQQPLLVDLIAYVLVFVLFLIVLSALTYLFSSIVKHSVLAIPNRICGILFGILRGILILAILDFGVGQYVVQDYEEYVKSSKLRPYVKETSKMIFIMLPENIRQSLLKHLSLEQQKELLDRFNISNNEATIQTLATHDDNATETNTTSDDSSSKDENKKNSIMMYNNDKQDNDKNKQNLIDSIKSTQSQRLQTAKELSELKVKKSDPSNFYNDTKKDLDKLLDAYT